MQVTAALLQIILLASMSTQSHAESDRYDSSAFAPNIKIVEEKPKDLPLTPNKKTGGDDEKASIESIDGRIQAFGTLIKTARTESERAQFTIARTLLKLQKAKMMADGSGPSTPAELKEVYKQAATDAASIKNLKKVSAAITSYGLYLNGLALLGLNIKSEAIKIFKKAIQINPKASYTADVIFYMAEFHYERESFLSAMQVLKTNMDKLDDDQKSLAKYRIAWCYIGLKELSTAEQLFIELIKSNAKGDFEKNIIKELSYVSTQIRNETGIAILADSVFGKAPDKKAEFLSSAYANLQRQDSKSSHQFILSKLMGLASSSEQRVKLWLEEVKSSRRPYASIKPYTNFSSIQQELGRYGDPEAQKVLQKLGEELELECEQLIKSFVGTYSGSVKNKENIRKEVIASSLQQIFTFQDRYFPKAKTRAKMFTIWMSLSEDTEDYPALLAVSNKILADPSLSSMSQRAKDDRLLALGNLNRSQKQKYAQEYQAKLEEYVADENAPHWKQTATELADFHMQNKDFKKGISLLSAINNKDKTEGSYFRLQTARFVAGQYKEVVAARPPSGVTNTQQMNNLVKEASLKLATTGGGGSSENFDDYENNINVFLSLNNDTSKEKLVIQDYINRLIEKKEYKKAALRLLSLPSRVRGTEYANQTKKVAILLMQEGEFREAAKIANEDGQPISKLLLNESTLSRLGSGLALDSRELGSLTNTNRDYILGVLALTQPQTVIQYASVYSSTSPSIKKLGMLALKIREKSDTLSDDMRANRSLASILPTEDQSMSSFRKQVSEVQFPKAGQSPTQTAKLTATAVSQVRKVRQQISGKIRGQSSANQIEVLQAAIRLEEQAATAIEKSPLPNGIDEKQKLQYMQNLTDAAGEFRDQAKEFRKTLDTIMVHSGEADQKRAESELPMPINLSKWPWPASPIKDRVMRFIQEDNRVAALIMLDLRKSANLMSASDYFQYRSGILLSTPNNPPMAKFVLNELREARQERIISQWKDMQ